MSFARASILAGLALLVCLAGSPAARCEDRAPYVKQALETYSIFVIGDSLAGGLFAGMDRAARGDTKLKVAGRFKEDSGLARPEIYDWPAALRKILEGQEVDIAIILIGSNDGQDMRPDGVKAQFGSPEWLAAYQAQLTALLDAFEEKGTAVYWVSLPPMGSADYEAKMRTIAEKQSEVLKAKGIRQIDIRPAFSKPDGAYTDSGEDINGVFMRLRERNGVNFLRSGNDKLAKIVLEAVRADLAVAGQQPEAESVAAEAPSDPVTAPGREDFGIPMFGQGLVTGEAEVLPPENLPPAGTIATARSDSGKGDREVTIEETEAAAGGSAAALYGSGRWPTVKPGRVDDFSVQSQ